MTSLIIFLLATTGVTLIVTKSLLFKSVRVFITTKHVDAENNEKPSVIWSFLSSVINCPMCTSPYAGVFCAMIIYLSQYSNNLIYILYPFAGAPVVTLIIQYYSHKERQP